VTPEAAAILAAAVRDAGRPVGLKLSGGIRGAGQATNYLALARDLLGPRWPAPGTFRIGASTLLAALVA
jgi:deoxyribose-phosphate aldolase